MATFTGTAGSDIISPDQISAGVIRSPSGSFPTFESDFLFGGNGNDRLEGGGGNDELQGGAGRDSLFGGSGADILNGGAGVDYMRGGSGNDRYFIFSDGEDVREEATVEGGIDTVLTGINYTLEVGFENLTLIGGTDVDISGTGNAANNTLIGNAGSNVLNGLGGNDSLDGGGGNDVLIGGSGNDRYVINSVGDVAFEESAGVAGGTDTVVSSISYTARFGIENIRLTGSANLNANGNTANNLLVGNSGSNVLSGANGNDVLQGFGGADRLIGGAGADRISGGAGVDRMAGGFGNDTFVFTSPADSGDFVSDFRNSAGNNDVFQIVAAQFGGALPLGALAADRFKLSTQALDANDRVIWNDATNQLFFDTNGGGAGGRTLLATLDNAANVTAADIFLI